MRIHLPTKTIDGLRHVKRQAGCSLLDAHVLKRIPKWFGRRSRRLAPTIDVYKRQNPPCHSANAYATAFLHGNYTNADGAINWAPGVTHTLPPSFYLSSTPAWWPSSLGFPAIGPDVTGAPGAGGHAGLIPAQNCYQNVMGGSEGGAGSPLTFNASTCYSSSQPQAPTQLKAVVH